ncbi:MAG TPA: SprT family zinc-dependent metalloprotease, partial [Ktedonobacterales bacterium]|nr:SprT family zinc-dependent metalloprotease [Ktedonobacterales bacterium]
MSLGVLQAAQLALLDEATAAQGAWRVRASDRARRLTVRVLPGGQVEIVVPRGTRPHTVEQFVTRYRPWIDRKVAQYLPLEPANANALPEFLRFRASGDDWPVAYVEATGAPRLAVDRGRLVLRGDLSRTVLIRHVLQRFTMRRAHAILVPQLERLSGEFGLPYARAQIRRQRTRWGSCSRRGTISLNACLVFQSREVVRYPLLHELAHTRHMNHS